ncbi:MAG: M23 family metallopeptidase [Patescibacteria group bacterium]
MILVNDSAVLNPAILSVEPISDNIEKNNYFIIPAAGWNWGGLHNNNAVDIANSCGTPVYAAAEGLVIETASNGWNSGYGAYVKIEHPNGAKTVYAHLGKTAVSEGKYVNQGKLIGNIGNTGNTHGPTGCHLHFEVRGAENPLAK